MFKFCCKKRKKRVDNSEKKKKKRKAENIKWEEFTKDERYAKAQRHFFDALHYRSVRHDIDGKRKRIILQIWKW